MIAFTVGLLIEGRPIDSSGVPALVLGIVGFSIMAVATLATLMLVRSYKRRDTDL